MERLRYRSTSLVDLQAEMRQRELSPDGARPPRPRSPARGARSSASDRHAAAGSPIGERPIGPDAAIQRPALEWPAMPRPRSVSRSSDAVISNAELARIFNEIGDMLEILGEVVYKAVAYRRVADAVERYPDDVASLFRRGEPPKLPGPGRR
jgi:hypothetical protein